MLFGNGPKHLFRSKNLSVGKGIHTEKEQRKERHFSIANQQPSSNATCMTLHAKNSVNIPNINWTHIERTKPKYVCARVHQTCSSVYLNLVLLVFAFLLQNSFDFSSASSLPLSLLLSSHLLLIIRVFLMYKSVVGFIVTVFLSVSAFFTIIRSVCVCQCQCQCQCAAHTHTKFGQQEIYDFLFMFLIFAVYTLFIRLIGKIILFITQSFSLRS